MVITNRKSNSLFKPSNNDICVVTCHFNFIGWKTPDRNLHRFLREFKIKGIDVFGAEAYLNKPSTEGNKNWIHIKATNKNICFQKEALLNIVIRNLPENYKKIIVCDHDISFERTDWILESSKLLDYHDFIQPFSTCIWTGDKGQELGRKESFFKSLDSFKGHPGFSIGFKRSSFNKIKFYPFCVVGGGDTIFAGSITGKIESTKLSFRRFFEDYKIVKSNEWYRKAVSENFSYTYLDGEIYHEYHGSKSNRKYRERGDIIKDFDFSNLFINDYGLVEFKNEGIKTQQEIYEYLSSRNEDS